MGREGDYIRGSNWRAAPPHDLVEAFDDAFRSETAGALDTADRGYREIVERAPDGPLKVRALLRRSHVQRSWGVWAEAARFAERARALAHAQGERGLEGESLNALAAVHLGRGELPEARRLYREALAVTDEPRAQGLALQNLGVCAAMEKRFDEAQDLFARSSVCFFRAGYPRGEAFALNNQGRVLLDQERAREALAPLGRAAAAAQEVDDLDLHALVVLNLAEAHLLTGATAAAMDCATQALGYFMAEENPARVVECMRIQGDIARRSGEVAEAERCYRRALSLAEDLRARIEIDLLRERLRRIGVRPGADPRSEEEA